MNLRFWSAHLPSSASEWFARLRRGKVSKDTDARFQAWLAHDANNERAYERQELAWEISLDLDEDPEIQRLIREAEQAPAPLRTSSTNPNHLRLGWIATAAAALVLGFALTVWWNARTGGGELYATSIGEQRTIILPDQSRLMLNTSTRVRVRYTRSVRSIQLEQGEATFKVAHDTAHPFEVRAAGAMARALGTEFNVQEGRQGVTVTVLEGRVEVLPADNSHTGGIGNVANAARSVVITGGEAVTYSAGRLSQVQAGQVQRITAWHRSRVSFQDVTLEEAIAEFNRYTQTPLVLGDPSLRAYRVSGVFRVGEMQALLNALQEAFGVKAEQRGNTIILWPKGHQLPIVASKDVLNDV